MKHIIFGLILATGLLFTSCSQKAQQTVTKPATITKKLDLNQPLPFDSRIIKGQLPNGITYYIRENHHPEKQASFRLIVKIGSIVEQDSEQGIAHFCEHMAFNGTKHFKKQELVDYLESIGMRFGADLNAYTSFDETVYMLQVPTDSLPLLQKAVLILEDWAHNVTYDPVEVNKERGVVISEWRRGLGASQRIRDKILPILLKDSRYALRLPIGKIKILETFTPDVPKKFYHKWYRPELMGVIAVGDFDAKQIESMIKEKFAGIQDPPNPPKRKYYDVPAQDTTLFAIATDPEASSAQVSIDYKMKADTQRTVGDYRNMIIENLASQMLSARINEYTQKKNPPFIAGGAYKTRLVLPTEVFGLSAMCGPEQLIPAFKTLLIEAKRVQEYGFTPTELARYKLGYLRNMEKAYAERNKTRSSNLVGEYQRNFLYVEPVPGIEREYELTKALLPTISVADVNKAVQSWLKIKDRVIEVTGPQKEGITIPSQDTLMAILNQVKSMKVSPYVDKLAAQNLINQPLKGGKVVKEIKHPEIGVTEWILNNGVHVILKPTTFKNDEISFRAVSPGGYSLVDNKTLISARMAAAIERESGVGPFTRLQLEKLLTGKIVRVSPYINETTEGLRGASVKKDLKTMFQLIYLNFTQPRFDSTAFLAYKSKVARYLQNLSRNPNFVYNDSVQAALTRHNERYKSLTPEMLKQVDLKTAEKFYRDRFADASDFTFIFVGSFTPDTLKPFIEKYLGSLPSIHRKEKWRDVTYTLPQTIIDRSLHKGMEPKSIQTVIFFGPFQWSLPNVIKGHFVTEILGIKLREHLREDKSGTYAPSVRDRFSHYPRQRYQIRVQYTCSPERVDELNATMFKQVDSLRNFGTTEKYLNKVKEMDLHEYNDSMKENPYWLNRLQFAVLNDIPLEHILEIDDLIQAVTLEDVHTMAKKLLNTHRYLRYVLLPEKSK